MSVANPILVERFWSKVKKVDGDGCWLWTGSKDSDGYGRFWYLGKPFRASRFSYERANEPVAQGVDVLHRCGNRLCVRPDHLVLTIDQDRAIERFWSKVIKQPDGCWEWTGALKDGRYGAFSHRGRIVRAHRFAYEIARGSVPERFCVCHQCDNPRCVRPDHLFLGTMAENVRDRDRKGRTALGMKTKSTKLTNEDVREIRRLKSEGMSDTALADMFGVSRSSIWRIANGRR